MKNFILLLAVIFLLSISIYAQEVETDKKNSSNKQGIEKVKDPLAVTDEIKFKNETGNPIITITDEGSNKGSVTFPEMTSSPSTTLNKLYNLSGDLMFSGSPVSGAQGIDNLSDAISDGSSLFIGNSSGVTDDGSSNNNLGVGRSALKISVSGYENTALGNNSMIDNRFGHQNTAVGYNSLQNNNAGHENTAMGLGALYANFNGNQNTAVGFGALRRNYYGNTNTAVGYEALNFSNNGEGNVALGHYAGANNTGNNKLFIENSASSAPLIGGDFSADEIYLNGKVGIGTQIPTYQLHVRTYNISEIALFENVSTSDPDGIVIKAGPDVNPTANVDYVIFQDGDGDNVGTIDGNGSGGVNYNTTSDARLKTKIEEYQNAIEIVSLIGIKKYERLSSPGIKEVGVLAQDLKKVYPQAVSGSPDSDVNNDPMMVDYSKLTPLLVKAMQEQQELIADLQNQIDELKKKK